MSDPFLASALCVIFLACSWFDSNREQDDEAVKRYREEIKQTENAFAQMAKTKSVREAFLAFAAPGAVLLRDNQLVKGPSEIADYFDEHSSVGTTLEWTPDFVDVAKSGDLGYTYGEYRFTKTDDEGKKTSSKGVFHTVWRRQEDGTWKYVWD